MSYLIDKHDIIEKCGALQSAADTALAEAYEVRSTIGGAVNWADLGCVDATWSIDQLGTEYFTIYIEEAAPYEAPLIKFVRERLELRGWHDISIVTEW